MTIPTRTLTDDPTEHLGDHNALHALYNVESADRGIVYVAEDGSDGNSGRSWTLPKLTIAAAQGVSGDKALILVGPGNFNIDASIELVDGQTIRGMGAHTNTGTVLQATAPLGTAPVMVNATGNLTAGGVQHMQLRGTFDLNGGVGLRIDTGMADGWLLDYVKTVNFTSHGFEWAPGSGLVAGNPCFVGVIDSFGCGLDGVGHGVKLSKPHSGTVTFRYIGGDNNGGSLLYVTLMNSAGFVRVDNLKAERYVTATHQDIVTVDQANGGALSIGSFRVYHNVGAAGIDGNSFLRETNGTGLRWNVENCFLTNAGAKSYTYGFFATDYTMAVADFVRTHWDANWMIGLKYGMGIHSGTGTPEGARAAPKGAIYLRADGAAGTCFYVKESGAGNTGWVAK